MDLFDSINRRKSCRNYTGQPFSEAQLEEVREAIESFDTLYPDVSLDYRFVTETKGMLRSKAPHYLIISGQGGDRESESAGFLFQQLVLWFDAKDIGSVWLGKTKDVKENQDGKDIIAIAFGQAEGLIHRKESEFKRKDIEEITNASDDPCIKAAHLAPSGVNLQPWYFEKTEDRILLYRQILKPPTSLVYKKTEVDMGIALCHYMVACKHFDRTFSFEHKNSGTSKKGYQLFGQMQR